MRNCLNCNAKIGDYGKTGLCVSCATSQANKKYKRGFLKKLDNYTDKNNPFYGKHHTEGTKEKQRVAVSGSNNPMFGLKGEEHPAYGRKFSEEQLTKMRKPKSSSAKRNIRIGCLRRIGNRIGKQIVPNYNIEACKIIDKYGKENNYNFQHAENGGEFHIKELGYWVDGYDENKNTVIEFFEQKHSSSIEKDMNRLSEIKDLLGCDIIILCEDQRLVSDLIGWAERGTGGLIKSIENFELR